MGQTGAGHRGAAGPSPGAPGAPGATITVAGFELLGELGRGARTVVHRARRTDTDDPNVALKILRDAADDAADVAAIFRREAALVARVSHPSLAAVHAVGEAGGRPYLVLELVDGASVAQLIEDGPLDQDRVVGLAVDAAEALAAVHRMRLVHRDVKPHNLLMTPEGRIKLIDFDLATWSGELAAGDTATGTLHYSAPEQTGMLTRPVDARSDLYALGVVLFECVTGRLPFASPDVGELLRLHAVEPPPDVRDLRPDCSPGLAAVITTLLAKDPDDRYQRATSLIRDLRRLREQPDTWPFPLDAARADMAVSTGQPPLVGRAAELTELTTSWGNAAQGGEVVLIEGDSGSGKTRLVDELHARVIRDGGCAVRAVCVPADPRPLGAISAAVQRHVEATQRLPPARREQAAQQLRDAAGEAAPLLAALSPVVAAVLGADRTALGEADRQDQVPVAIARFLAALARLKGHMLLVLDDAGHVDGTSARVLSHLRLHDQHAPLLTIVAAAPDTANSLEADRRIRLAPLPPAAVTELITTELGGAGVPAGLAAQLAARADGSPFAVLEFLRHLIEAGGLEPSWGTWKLNGDLLDRLHLPSDVLDLVLARLDSIPLATRRLLAAAAVQGMRFDTTVLARSVPVAPEQLGDTVAAATRQRIAEHVAGEVYAFVHAELRAALLADLDEHELAVHHRRVAEVLESRPPRDIDHVYAVARHWVAAGVDAEPHRSYAACAAAGRTALAQHTPAEAAEFLANAARAARAAGVEVDFTFRQTYATALLRSGDFATARNQLDQALRAQRHPVQRAQLLNLVAKAQQGAGDSDQAIETVRQGLAELGVPMPRRLPLLVVSTLARFVAGLLVGAWRRRGRPLRIPRRSRVAAEASLLNTGARNAAFALDNTMLIVFLLGGLLPVNRIGASPERVHIVSHLGFLACFAGMQRLGPRMCAAAQRDATCIGDPTLIADAAWTRAVGAFLLKPRAGTLTDVFQVHGRWLELHIYLTAITGFAPQLISMGHTTGAETWLRRTRTRLQRTSGLRDDFAVECMAGAVEGVRGRAAAAEATLQAALDCRGGAITAQQRVHLEWARLIMLTEQREVGTVLDDVVAALDDLEMSPIHPHARSICYTVTFGRLAQAHATTGVERDRRLRQARAGIRALRRGPRDPRLAAGRLAFRAWARHLQGRDRVAQRLIHRALAATDHADAPQLSFDALVIHARLLRGLGEEEAAQRQATFALMLAVEHGWEYRVRWVRGEFGIQDGGVGSPRSMAIPSRRATSSSQPGDLHQGRRLDALTQVSATAAAVVDPDELIRVALDVMLHLLAAERAFLFLGEPHADASGEIRRMLQPYRGRDVDGSTLRELTNYSTPWWTGSGRPARPLWSPAASTAPRLDPRAPSSTGCAASS